MKTILTALLLAYGLAMADECDVQPRLTFEHYENPPRMYMTWRAADPCFWWYMEQSTNIVHWRTFTGQLTYNCRDGNTNNCFWYAVATNSTPTTFYRLRLVPN